MGDRPYLLSVRLAGRRGWLNHVRRLLGVVLPVMKSALMTCVIFGFIATWNELLVALVFISDPAKMTIRLKRKAVE
ncbi:hypothetical protein ACFQZT_00625 [Paenibacillus sp. GCM10027628]|uniref:hypothetical protein n=1 Tax=Paenibacillus sp. GCM10027628 TaxID=3273413 RepID=UPI0036359C22